MKHTAPCGHIGTPIIGGFVLCGFCDINPKKKGTASLSSKPLTDTAVRWIEVWDARTVWGPFIYISGLLTPDTGHMGGWYCFTQDQDGIQLSYWVEVNTHDILSDGNTIRGRSKIIDHNIPQKWIR